MFNPVGRRWLSSAGALAHFDVVVPMQTELDAEEKSDQSVTVYARALDVLVRREHSRSELRHKLSKRGYHSAEIESALNRLTEDGYLSDARYAQLYAEQRVAKGHGRLKVQAELMSRGVDSGLASSTLEHLDTDWTEVAVSVLRAKCGDTSDYARQRRVLERRGFTSSEARAAIAQVQAF